MEILKDINEFYKSLLSFWDTVYPTILFNVLFLILFPLISGINFFSLGVIESWVKSEQYQKLKNVLKAFGFESKISIGTIIAGAIFYIVIFTSSMNLILKSKIPFISPTTFDLKEYYAKKKPVTELAYIARFSAVQPPSLDEIIETQRIIGEQYLLIDEEGFKQQNSKFSEDVFNNITIIKFGIVSIFLAIIIYAYKIKNVNNRLIITLRCLLYIVLNILFISYVNSVLAKNFEKKAMKELQSISAYAKTRNFPTKGNPYIVSIDSIPYLEKHIFKICKEYRNK